VSNIVVADHVSKWYGHVLGVSDVSWSLGGGIVGLLGPNGAGKSTLIKMMAGLLRPSRGTLTVFGSSPFDDVNVRRRIGYAPEHEKTWDELTPLELVTAMAELAGVPTSQSHKAAAHAIAEMGMTEAQGRRIKGFSKGMRQRTKLATAIAHDPDFILLDEPLTGVDPMARIDIVERIRKLIDRHPHRIRVDCDKPHVIGSALAAADHVARIVFERGAVVVETRDPDRCYDQLSDIVLAGGVSISSMTSPDNNLGAVFEYLTGDGGRR
jgi:ABC-2 type transport system ATP-binding protein